MRILVISDDVTIRHSFGEALNADLATSENAVTRLLQISPDTVIIDLEMGPQTFRCVWMNLSDEVELEVILKANESNEWWYWEGGKYARSEYKRDWPQTVKNLQLIA
jgi:DNA-binding NarL/FixJ family response regulator